MKEKIIAAFKVKYPGINLSKTRLAAIATKIEAKVIDDETKIDAALAAMDETYAFADIAKDDDRIRTLEGKLKDTKPATETPAEKAAREAAEAAAALESDKDTPAWAKAIIEQNKTFAQQLANIQVEKTTNTIKGKVIDSLKDKGVPVEFWEEWALPESEDALPQFTEKIVTKFEAINQQRTEQGLSALSAPKGGGAGGQDGKPPVKAASKEEVEAVVNNIM